MKKYTVLDVCGYMTNRGIKYGRIGNTFYVDGRESLPTEMMNQYTFEVGEVPIQKAYNIMGVSEKVPNPDAKVRMFLGYVVSLWEVHTEKSLAERMSQLIEQHGSDLKAVAL